jgi:hypothetical protein
VAVREHLRRLLRAVDRGLALDGKTGAMAGCGLLFVAFAIGSLTLHFGLFSDEGDKLAGGWLIASGQVLYRDFFSHHFPFAYYWAAAIVKVFGPALYPVRYSLLAFQLVTFGLLIRFSRAYVLLGIAAVAWNAIAHLYGGQMLLYNGFAALALMATTTITVVLVAGWRPPGRAMLGAFGVYAAIAILSDPISTLPVALGLFALATSPCVGRRALLPALVCGFILGVWGGCLLISGTLDDFIAGALAFNRDVYSKYSGIGFSSIARSAYDRLISGLDLFSPVMWWRHRSALHLVDRYPSLFRWLFDGFLFRLSALLAVVSLLTWKQARAAAVLYISAALVLARAETDIRHSPFILLILASTALIGHRWLLQTQQNLPLGSLIAPPPAGFAGVLAPSCPGYSLDSWSGRLPAAGRRCTR